MYKITQTPPPPPLRVSLSPVIITDGGNTRACFAAHQAAHSNMEYLSKLAQLESRHNSVATYPEEARTYGGR
jgi:hypothetical protein